MLDIFSTRAKAFNNLNGKAFKDAHLRSDSVLLDVRTPGEHASGTINGAQNMDIMSPGFSDLISKLDRSKQYFVFCHSGNRSAHACSILAGQGFKVNNLDGGIREYPF